MYGRMDSCVAGPFKICSSSAEKEGSRPTPSNCFNFNRSDLAAIAVRSAQRWLADLRGQFVLCYHSTCCKHRGWAATSPLFAAPHSHWPWLDKDVPVHSHISTTPPLQLVLKACKGCSKAAERGSR